MRAAARRRCGALGLEDVHGPHDVLPADRALVHPLAALGAGDHVAALEEHAVDHGVHADPAEVVVVDRQRAPLAVCEANAQRGERVCLIFVRSCSQSQKCQRPLWLSVDVSMTTTLSLSLCWLRE